MSSQRRGTTLNSWIAGALLAALPVGTVLSQGKPDRKQTDAGQAQAQAQSQEVQTLVRLADAAMTGQQVPSDFPIQFQNDFLKAQASRVWVPMTLTLDPSKLSTGALTFYFRVAPRGMTAPPAAPAATDQKKNDKDKKKDKDKDKDAKQSAPPSAYPFEDVSFLDLKPVAGQPYRIVRGFGVPPGSYDLYLVVRERPAAGATGATPKAAVLKQPLEVPNYASDFATSTVIIAERVETLPAAVTPDQQTEHPYAFGQQEIVVSPERKFKKGQELIVLLQIYNPTISSDKKFNLEATYTFYRQGPDGEKKFNATEPQTFTPESMGAGFDPSAGEHSIQAGQGIPLQSFPEGTYRLEIKITDKLANPGKVLTQNVNFTVTS